MRFSFVADHFQYLASLGPIALAVSAATAGAQRLGARGRRGAWLCAGLLLVTLGTLTARRVPVYQGLESLWVDTLRQNPASYLAHYNLAELLRKRGDVEAAKRHYEASIEAAPDLAMAQQPGEPAGGSGRDRGFPAALPPGHRDPARLRARPRQPGRGASPPGRDRGGDRPPAGSRAGGSIPGGRPARPRPGPREGRPSRRSAPPLRRRRAPDPGRHAWSTSIGAPALMRHWTPSWGGGGGWAEAK